MRPAPPEVRVRVRNVQTHGLPGWVDVILIAWFVILAWIPFAILGWALWDQFA